MENGSGVVVPNALGEIADILVRCLSNDLSDSLNTEASIASGGWALIHEVGLFLFFFVFASPVFPFLISLNAWLIAVERTSQRFALDLASISGFVVRLTNCKALLGVLLRD